MNRGRYGFPVSTPQALTLIERVVTTGTQATLEFTGIPQHFADLMLVGHARGAVSGSEALLRAQINKDVGSTYTYVSENRFGIGGPTTSAFLLIGNIPGATAPAARAGWSRFEIPAYAGTVFEKFFRSEYFIHRSTAAGDNITSTTSGYWASTEAVMSLTLVLDTGSFVDGSEFTLYGVGAR